MASDKLETITREVLKLNDQGHYTMPALGLYPHQWLWDSCFIAIGLRHFDVERAKIELLSLLRGQWHNGMIPHMIMTPSGRLPEGAYKHNGNIWRSWLNPNAPDDVSTSGITQPPMLAEAVVRVGEKLSKTERRSWYKQVYSGLLAYHQWLFNERDPHDEGLVLQIHPWETGLDNTPPWMAELNDHLLPWWIRLIGRAHLDTVIGWFRADKRYVGQHERMTTVEALALYDVQRRLRRKNYDFDRYIDHSLFAIEDLGFNCIFIRANRHLIDIAKIIGEELPEDLVERIKKSERALDQLWDDYAEEFFSRDFVSHRLLKESSVATLLPLYAGCITKEQAQKLAKLLENDHRFGPPYPAPSAPLDSPWFQPRRYWQGPTWVNINWLVIDGLRRYGFTDHADALRESTLEMVGRSGCSEYFDPLTGEPAGATNFSWTAALSLDLLKTRP